MTISVSEALLSGPYNGDGATTTFDYDFKIYAETELSVLRQNADGTVATLALTTDYTVDGVGDAGGGTVTLTAGSKLPSGATMTVEPDVTMSQDRPFSTQSSTTLAQIELALDKATSLIRQLLGKANRSLKVSAARLASGFSTDLSGVANGSFLYVKADGSGITGASGQLQVSEVAAWFHTRDVTSAMQAALLADGSIVSLHGLLHKVDSTVTGIASATSDLGVDGLTALGVWSFADEGDVPPHIVVGQRVRIAQTVYEGAATGVTNHDLLTTNGVKLYRRAEVVKYRDGNDGALFDVPHGGSGSETWVFNSYLNAAADGVGVSAITGGGSTNDEQYIGFKKNREVLTATGTAQVWSHLPTDNDVANLRVFKRDVNNVQTSFSTPTHYTGAINGSQVDITLVTGLVSGERLIVEDKAAQVTYTGTRPDYSWIGAGYDNVIEEGVMQQVTGAHHRVTGGDHGTILGGSYSWIAGGSYGFVGGGTSNEIGTGGGVGSVALGGYRNRANGATSTIVGGQSNLASGAQSAIVGGQKNTVSGTASFVGGRNNTVSAADSIVFGDGNAVSAQYSVAYGTDNTVSHKFGAAKGEGAVTSWQGQDVRFAMRDGVALTPQRQHFFIDLNKYTTGTASQLIGTIDGVTGFAIPASTGWKCKLHITARGGNLKIATFEIDFAVQNSGSGVAIVGTPVETAFIDPGMGTGGNVAGVSVAINGSNLEITIQPRQDTGVGTLWAGVLEVLEVH